MHRPIPQPIPPRELLGQQQLLLLVLGIVIVGLAVVVGLQAFSENRSKVAGDEIVAVGARIASEATAWVLQPTQVGGGGGEPTGLAFAKLGYTEQTDGSYATGDASYTLTADATAFVITGTDNQARAANVTAVYGVGEACLALALSRDGTTPETPEAPSDCAGW